MKNSDLPPSPIANPKSRPAVRWGFIVCVSGVLFLALAGVALPTSGTVCVRGSQTKAVAQAKQIGLALRLYAEDHGGAYPSVTNDHGETIRTSNDAFRSLFPTYTMSEKIFANALSAYQTRPADDVIAPIRKSLEPGENVYGYVRGLHEGDSPALPLVADGGDGTGRGLYVSDPHKLGGTWKGMKAVVIRLDNSGAVENLTGPANARFISTKTPDGATHNLLASDQLGTGKFTEPAVARP